MADAVTMNVVPNEVMTVASVIEVASTEPFDPRSAQASITLHGESTIIELSDDGRTATVRPASGGELRPGAHVLVVDEPLSIKGNRLADRMRVPFVVTDTRAELPADVRVEAMIRLSIDELRTTRLPLHGRPDGPFIEVFKASDRATGEPIELAFDHHSKRIDAVEVFSSIARNRLKTFGKLQEELHERLERDAGEVVTVAIWLATSEVREPPDKPTERPAPEPPEAEQKQMDEARRLTARFAELARADYGAEIEDPDPVAPMVVATLSGKRLQALAERDDVAAVLLHATDAVLDLGDSMAIANTDDVHALGFDAAGVNIAVCEDGPEQVNLLPIVAGSVRCGWSIVCVPPRGERA